MTARRLLAALAVGALASASAPAPAPTPAHGDPRRDLSDGSRIREIPPHPSRLEFPPRIVRIPDAAAHLHRLESGLSVVVVEDHTLPLVDVVLALPREHHGARESPALAELGAAMMRRGGTVDRSASEFDAAVDYLGAEIDARATAERRVARLDALADGLDEALELFFEMLRAPAYEAERIAQARDNLLAALRARNDDPIEVMERELGWLLFGPGAPRAAQLTSGDLAALEPAELRRHHRAVWRPEGGVVAVSGAVDTAWVLGNLEEHLERWRETVSNPALPQPLAAEQAGRAEAGPAVHAPAPPGLYWARHRSRQAKVSVALRLEPSGDWNAERAAALDLANEILGGTGLLSRLGGRLRGREGLVYRVLSEVELERDEPGLFRVFLDTDAVDLGRALSGIVEEIERLRRDPVGEGELEAVRQELLSRTAHRFDTAEEVAGYFAEDLLVGRPHEYWSDYLHHLSSATAAAVRAATRARLDPSALTVVVVGGPESLSQLHGVEADHPLVRRWLETARELPRRDPSTLDTIGEVEPK